MSNPPRPEEEHLHSLLYDSQGPPLDSSQQQHFSQGGGFGAIGLSQSQGPGFLPASQLIIPPLDSSQQHMLSQPTFFQSASQGFDFGLRCSQDSYGLPDPSRHFPELDRAHAAPLENPNDPSAYALGTTSSPPRFMPSGVAAVHRPSPKEAAAPPGAAAPSGAGRRLSTPPRGQGAEASPSGRGRRRKFTPVALADDSDVDEDEGAHAGHAGGSGRGAGSGRGRKPKKYVLLIHLLSFCER